MTTRAETILFMLDHMDDSNYHVCGNNWQTLDELRDAPGGVYGDLAAWVECAARAVGYAQYALTQHHARWILGITDAQWCAMDGLPLGHVQQRLRHLLDCEERKAKPEGAIN